MLQQAHHVLQSGQSVANKVTEGAMAAIHAGENTVEHVGNQFRNEKERTHAQSLETMHKVQNKAKEMELHQQHQREEIALKKAHQEIEGESIHEDIQAGLMAAASAKYREEQARKSNYGSTSTTNTMAANTSHAPTVTQF